MFKTGEMLKMLKMLKLQGKSWPPKQKTRKKL